LKVDYKLVNVNLAKGESHTPDYLKVTVYSEIAVICDVG